MGPAKDQLDFEQEVSDGWSIQVPAGSWHDVVNTGDEPLRLYAIYAPVHHAPGIVQRSSADAERDEAAGVDEPRPGACSPRAAPRTSTPTDLPDGDFVARGNRAAMLHVEARGRSPDCGMQTDSKTEALSLKEHRGPTRADA